MRWSWLVACSLLLRPVKVWRVFTCREGELATEIWRIAPAIHLGP